VKGPTRASVAGRTYLDLQNKARREKRPTQEFFDLYVSRLSESAGINPAWRRRWKSSTSKG